MKSFVFQNGDLLLANRTFAIIENKESLRQKLILAMNTFSEEWYFNPDSGMPWFDILGEKGISQRLLTTELKKLILSFDEVLGIEYFYINYDESREPSIDIAINSIYGEIVL